MAWTEVTPTTKTWTAGYPEEIEVFPGGWFDGHGWFISGWFGDMWDDLDDVINTWTAITTGSSTWTEATRTNNTWSS